MSTWGRGICEDESHIVFLQSRAPGWIPPILLVPFRMIFIWGTDVKGKLDLPMERIGLVNFIGNLQQVFKATDLW